MSQLHQLAKFNVQPMPSLRLGTKTRLSAGL